MKQQWYVICTQKCKEKKVVAVLNKKGIENYCPFTIIEKKDVSRKSKEYGPLFSSLIFIKMYAHDLQQLKTLPYVINPLFWKNEPAIINNDEINAIKMMCENYSSIQVEKIAVNASANISVIEKNSKGYNAHTVSVQHHGITISLPNMGYALSANREKATNTTEKHTKTPKVTATKRFNPLAFLGINL